MQLRISIVVLSTVALMFAQGAHINDRLKRSDDDDDDDDSASEQIEEIKEIAEDEYIAAKETCGRALNDVCIEGHPEFYAFVKKYHNRQDKIAEEIEGIIAEFGGKENMCNVFLAAMRCNVDVLDTDDCVAYMEYEEAIRIKQESQSIVDAGSSGCAGRFYHMLKRGMFLF